MEPLRRTLALLFVAFLALAPALHIHTDETSADHVASCVLASLASAEVGAAPAARPAPASRTPAPVLVSSAPRSVAARVTPAPRGPPTPLV